MFEWYLKKNNKLLSFQLKNKTRKKNFNNSNKLLKCLGIIDILNVKKIKSPIVLKYLLLLELIFGNKSFIKKYVMKYQQSRIQLFLKINSLQFYYIYFLIKYFYSPLLIKQKKLWSAKSFDTKKNYWFVLKNINLFPFMLNSYFLSRYSVKIGLFFHSKNQKENELILKSWNFYN